MAKTAKAIAEGKLTKKFLFDLPTNSYLVSNLVYDENTSIYENRVAAISERENQWNEIKKVSANHRLCNAFRNKSDYKIWKSQFFK